MGIDFIHEFFKLLNNYNLKSIDKFFSLMNNSKHIKNKLENFANKGINFSYCNVLLLKLSEL